MIELNQRKVNFENIKIIGYDMLNYNNYITVKLQELVYIYVVLSIAVRSIIMYFVLEQTKIYVGRKRCSISYQKQQILQ